MPVVTLENGWPIYYTEANPTGDLPLVLVHGSGANRCLWKNQIEALARDPVRVIALDLPGHGRSGGEAQESVPAYSDSVHRFARALSLPPFVLAGHSLGGAIVLEYALQYPGELRGMVLVGSGGRLRVLPTILEALRRGEHAFLTGYAYSNTAPPELVTAGEKEELNTDPALYLADLTACDRFDRLASLPYLKTPALIITGSGDRLTPINYARYMEINLPQASLHEVAGAGHMVMLENPETVNRAVAAFCRSLE